MTKWFKHDARFVRRSNNGKGTDDAWTQVTIPAANITPASGALTSRSGTLRYKKIGTTVFLHVSITITNAGTGAGALNVAGMPYPVAASGIATTGVGRENVLTGFIVTAVMTAGNSTLFITRYDGATIIGSGRRIDLTITYETDPD